MASASAGPRRLDHYQQAKIQGTSLERYRRALHPFVAYLVEGNFVPYGAEQWDDLVVEWHNDTRPSKANFEACVAAVEFIFLDFAVDSSGPMRWSRVGQSRMLLATQFRSGWGQHACWRLCFLPTILAWGWASCSSDFWA